MAADEWDKRKNEIEEQDCSDYFSDPKNQLPRAGLMEAVTAAIRTIYDFNDMLPKSKRYENPMEYLANKYGHDCEMTLLDFDGR